MVVLVYYISFVQHLPCKWSLQKKSSEYRLSTRNIWIFCVLDREFLGANVRAASNTIGFHVANDTWVNTQGLLDCSTPPLTHFATCVLRVPFEMNLKVACNMIKRYTTGVNAYVALCFNIHVIFTMQSYCIGIVKIIKLFLSYCPDWFVIIHINV